MIAMGTILVLGLVLAAIGSAMAVPTLRGVGILFAIFGGGAALALALRWLIYREIG
jgi:hypothetical protein